MKTITLNIKCILLLILISTLTQQLQGQTVTTLVEAFPGDGEISIDNEGFIYVNDSGENGNLDGKSVWKVDPQNGSFSMFRDNLPIWVVGSMFDLSGNLLVTGWQAGTVSRISSDGSSDSIIISGVNGAGSLEVDELGNIYVVEYILNNVKKYDSNGVFVENIASGSPVVNPAGLAYVQATGKMYVSNWTNGNIIEIDMINNTSSIFATIDTPNVGPIKIYGNYMYATSPGYHRIYVIDMLTGESELFAGTGTPTNVDGDISTATFNTPTGIGSPDNGNTLYIAEMFQGTGRLRVIEDVLGYQDNSDFEKKAKLFPNPGNDQLRLNYHGNEKITETTFYDVQGRKMNIPTPIVLSNGIEFNIEGIKPGIYFLKVRLDNTTTVVTYSFIKE